MFSALWGRITGADKKKALPDQQASILGRLGDYIVIYPYGLYCDLPNNVWLSILGKGKAIPVTSSRPASARGEIVLFHPETGDKIHLKNDGSIDVVAGSAVNVTAPNMTFNGDVVFNGNVAINGNLSVSGAISGAGVTDTTTNVTLGTHTHNGGTVPAPDPGS